MDFFCIKINAQLLVGLLVFMFELLYYINLNFNLNFINYISSVSWFLWWPWLIMLIRCDTVIIFCFDALSGLFWRLLLRASSIMILLWSSCFVLMLYRSCFDGFFHGLLNYDICFDAVLALMPELLYWSSSETSSIGVGACGVTLKWNYNR